MHFENKFLFYKYKDKCDYSLSRRYFFKEKFKLLQFFIGKLRLVESLLEFVFNYYSIHFLCYLT